MTGIVATDDIKRATLRAVASHLKSQFTKTKIDPQSIRMAQVDELKKSFAPKIKQLLEHANANPAYYDKVLTIQQNVVEVTNIVEKNVDKLLQQGEKLENLEIKTSELEAQTAMYHKAAKKLNQEVFWQNKKMMCVAISIAMLVLLVVAIVISAALGAFRL